MKKLLYKFWKGEITLWKSYWLFGEILNAIFLFLLLNLEIYMFKNTGLFNNVLFFDFRNLTILSKIIIIIWTLFITVGVWWLLFSQYSFYHLPKGNCSGKINKKVILPVSGQKVLF